jgi:hypothetical protein
MDKTTQDKIKELNYMNERLKEVLSHMKCRCGFNPKRAQKEPCGCSFTIIENLFFDMIYLLDPEVSDEWSNS